MEKIVPNKVSERMSAPDEIVLPLLPFQEEFLAWAVKQEENYHYGILADEMGMGKLPATKRLGWLCSVENVCNSPADEASGILYCV